MTRRGAVLLLAVVAALGVAVVLLLRPAAEPATSRTAVAFGSVDALQTALTSALSCEPVMTYNRYTSSCATETAVLTFSICDPDDGPGHMPRFGPVLLGADWCLQSSDAASLPVAQEALGGEVMRRAAPASRRMQGYIPPCRVVTPEKSPLAHGIHLDADGACPPS